MENQFMVRCVIIDDEEDAREILKRHLHEFNHIKIVGEANNADDGRKLIIAENPELVFLDIAMPRKSGFELLESLPDFQGQVIFITAFNQFAERAFKYLALGYIVKPIVREELNNTLAHAVSIIKSKQQSIDYQVLLDMMNTGQEEKKKIIIPTEKGFEILAMKEILYLEADGNYSLVKCKDRIVLCSRNLSKIEDFLNEEKFYRIHKSYTVNLDAIIKITHEGIVYLQNGDRLTVSRRKKNDFFDKINRL